MFYKDRFREIRKRAKRSQGQVGKVVGKDRMAVNRWEMGKHTPRESDIRMMAQYLNISVGEISDLKEMELTDSVANFELAEVVSEFRYFNIEDQAKMEKALLIASKLKNDYENIKADLIRCQTALNTVRTFIYTKNADSEFTYVNEEFLSFLGRDKATIIGKTNMYAFSPGEMTEVERLEKKVLSGQEITDIEIPMPGDHTQKGSFSGRPIVDSRSLEVTGLTAFINNITTQVKARNRYEILETAVNSSNEVLWIKRNDIQGRVINISDAITDLTGYHKKVFFDNPALWLNKIVHPNDRKALGSYYRKQSYLRPIEYKILVEEDKIKHVSEQCYQIEKHGENYLFGVIRDTTKQKEADEARVLLEDAFNKINVGISLLDPVKNKCVYASKGAGKVWGTTQKRMKEPGIFEHYIDDIIHPDDREKHREYFKDIDGVPEKRIDRIVHKQKGTRFIEVFRGMQKYKDRSTILNIVRDITEEKELEEELFFLSKVVNDLSDVVWIRTAQKEDVQFLYINNAVKKIFQENKKVFFENSSHLDTLVHPDDKKRVFEWWEEDKTPGKNKEASNIIYRIIRSDGKIRWLEDTHYNAPRWHGKKTRFGIIKDITENKEANRQNQELRAAISNIQDVVWTGVRHANKINYTSVNEATKALLGLSEEQFFEDEWIKHVHPDFLDEVKKYLKNTITNPKQIEYKYIHPVSGKTLWLQSRINIDNKYHFGVIRDITNRKREEQKLTKALTSIGKYKSRVDFIVNATNTAMAFMDHDYNVLDYVSDKIIKDRGSFKGKKCYEWAHKRNSACKDCLVEKAFESKKVERNIIVKNGVPLQVFAVPFKEDGKWYCIEFVQDVSFIYDAKDKNE